jgi:hypothetical protein
MKLGSKISEFIVQMFALILFALLLPQFAHAQKGKSAPAPAPHAAAPAPHAAAPAPHAAAPAAHTAAPAAHPSGTGAAGGNASHTTANAAHPSTTTAGHTGTTTGTAGHPTTTTNTKTTTPTNTRTAAATNTRTATGANTRTTTGAASGKTGTGTTTAAHGATTGAGAGKTGAGNTTAAHGASTGAGAGKSNAGATHNAGTTTKTANGGTKTVHSNGSTVERSKSGHVSSVTTAKGNTAKMDSHGRVASVHDGHGTSVNRGPHGERRVESRRKDGTRVVSYGHGRGFAEHRFSRGGREYSRRTYWHGGRGYGRMYGGYRYHGYGYNRYYPPYYYGAGYYGWAYNPWASPVAYSWGWGGAPWYQPYGYYFQPYPVYPSAAFWLTDFMVAATIQASAEAAAESGMNQSGDPRFVLASARFGEGAGDSGAVLTPEIKEMLADDVKAQIEADKAAAAAQGSSAGGGEEVPPSLDPKRRVFLASAAIDPALGDTTCALTSGDVIKRTEDTPDGDQTVAVVVLASKKDDCAIGSTPRVAVTDLEDMHDQFVQQYEAGMKSLGENQGKNGIPSGPAPTTKANPDGVTAPDLTVGDDLKAADQAGDAAEQDVQAAAADDGTTDAAENSEAPPAPQGDGGNIQIGMSIADVVKALGMPKQIQNAGAAQVYVYKDLKVTIQQGKVVDVQ